MNKAFVREPDLTDAVCPACGGVGDAVDWETVTSIVKPEFLSPVAPVTRDAVSYCGTPSCSIIYFDSLGRSIGREVMKTPSFPKDPTAPICPCFGFSTDEIELDLAEGAPTRTRAAIKRAQSDEADCIHRHPSGKSCAADLQSYYIRRQSST
jgi:hypothetical protein